MLKLFLALSLLGALALAAAFVPLGGRTVLDRWNAAPGAGEFFARGFAEAKGALGLGGDRQAEKRHPSRAPSARPPKAHQRRAGAATPTEQHSDEDRAALDRIVAEHAGR